MKTGRLSRRNRAFTLVEVLLAVGIIAGLLVVVLFFYQRAAQLRTDLLLDAERSSAARLLMERLTAELRTARSHTFYAVPLAGGSTHLQFIAVDLPSQSPWAGERFGRVSHPESDLKLVSYGAEVSLEDTNIVGLGRSEAPLVDLRTAVPESTVVLPAAETNKANSVLLTEAFRFIRFRYWDGYDWRESWSETFLPKGVEVSLGSEPVPAELEGEEYPYEVFRRVIYLPGSAENDDDMLFDLLFEPTAETAEAGR
jgi:prepilin-type N-terminal cleavage/methylation domain-containing protein